jgi:transcription elongation factor GreA
MAVKQVTLTAEGKKKLELELEDLKGRQRREVAEEIKVALGYGDLSENSEYDEAKNKQALIESKIMELEAMLKNAKVIDTSGNAAGVVHLGSSVLVYDPEFEEEVTYKIVGSKEANPLEDMISDESPVGKALLGRVAGDEVVVEAPGGQVVYQVREVLN